MLPLKADDYVQGVLVYAFAISHLEFCSRYHVIASWFVLMREWELGFPF